MSRFEKLKLLLSALAISVAIFAAFGLLAYAAALMF
jgi:hypothetical protein